jgi:hypothetical protein
MTELAFVKCKDKEIIDEMERRAGVDELTSTARHVIMMNCRFMHTLAILDMYKGKHAAAASSN